MRVKPGSHLVLVGLLALLTQVKQAHADFAECSTSGGVLPDCSATSNACCKKAFTADLVTGDKPLIIPMDRCHQPGPWAAPPGSSPPRAEYTFTWTKSGSTVTATTSTAHGIAINRDVYIKIAGSSTFATGTYYVTSKGGSTFEFTYTTSTTSCAANCGRAQFHNEGQGWCLDAPGSATRIAGNSSDDGMTKAYGLVYRLMQRSIPVYWIVNPTKQTVAMTATLDNYLASDVDAWVVTSDITDPPTGGASLTPCTGTGCTQPVHRLNQSTLSPYTDSYQAKEFPIRGGAFLIAAEDRAKFNDFWKRSGAYSSLSATKYNWTTNTNEIDLYEIDAGAKFIHQNFTSGEGTSTSPYATVQGAPVAVKIDYEPPRVACLGCTAANPGKFLDKAGLKDPPTDASSCLTGEFIPSDAVYCQLSEADVAAGTLVAGNFKWAWLFGFSSSFSCSSSAEKAVFDKLRDFMTTLPAVRNAGHTIVLNDAIDISERCANKQLLGSLGSGTSYGLPTQSATVAEPYVVRFPSNLFMQFGDLAPSFAGGTVSAWDAYSGGAQRYQSTLAPANTSLRRLVSQDSSANTLCLQHVSTAGCDAGYNAAAVAANDAKDLVAYGRLSNVFVNGLAYYLPGNQLDTNGTGPELRMLLNSLIALPDETFTSTFEELEVARTQPVVATLSTVETLFVPTYIRRNAVGVGPPPIPQATTTAGLNRFTYPYIEGHMRAIPVDQYTQCTGANCTTDNTTRVKYSSLTNTFDAANGIPAVTTGGCGSNNFKGTCRTVFTNLATGKLPARVYFTDSDANMTTPTTGTSIGSLISNNLSLAEKKLLVSRILKGWKLSDGTYVSRLGGVNRSTPAVIEKSLLTGKPTGKSSDRPTMAYFGATDGMLHAVCADVNTEYGCDVAGRELWAFIPRTQLPDLKYANAHIDGSPVVIDAYGNFDNTGNAWKTIMIFSTGSGSMASNNTVPAVYAFDITTPDNPTLLWEYGVTNVGARGTVEMGVSHTLSAGAVLNGTTREYYVWVQSNNGGTGGAGSVLTAINIETGAKVWQKGDIVGTTVRTSTHESIPAGAIPGGAVGFDKVGNNYITHVVYGTIYGEVFVRDAVTGANQNGASSGVDIPLFKIAADYKPIGAAPAIYKDGSTLYAAFATGGYVDSQATLWRGANEATVPSQVAFAVSLNYTTTTTLTDASTRGTNLPFLVPFKSTSDGSFAQPVVIGTEIFFVTDSTNINAYDYGSYAAPTGKMYRIDIGGTPTDFKTGTVQGGVTGAYFVTIAGGAASLFNTSDGKLLTAGGAFGERTFLETNGSTGVAVDLSSTKSQGSRRLWIRTE